MPSIYSQPAAFGNATVEDVARFNQLPFYLVRNEVRQFPTWSVFDQLYGDIDWQANEGNTMKGVTPQRSPVGRSFFFPNAITTVPSKDIYQVTESVETTQLYMHDYESFQFNFLPSFTIFWKNYLQFANADIVRQIAVSNNQFIETNMWFNSPYIYIAGTGALTYGAPVGMGNANNSAAGSKTAAWLVATTIGSANNPGVSTVGLRLRDIFNCFMTLQEDLAAPAFDGSKNMPKDNEGLRGKYVVLISNEDFLNFSFDPDVLNKLSGLAPCDLNLLFNDFKGLLFGSITCKINRYPIRYNIQDVSDPNSNVLYPAGTPIAPEVFDPTDNKWKPNPYYTSRISGAFTISWILGADRAKTVKVGPPPKEFATTNMSAKKFYAMRWNGEVQLTDQVLIFDGNGVPSLNNYGKQLKFISELTHGYLEGERRYAFPIISKRTRPANAI
jgi:hypothetical protein